MFNANVNCFHLGSFCCLSVFDTHLIYFWLIHESVYRFIYNVTGLGNKTKRGQMIALIKTNNISLCILQETHSGDSTHFVWKREWNNDAFFSIYNNNRDGKEY